MPFRNRRHHRMLEQMRRLDRVFQIHLDVPLGSEAAICGDLHAFACGVLEETVLDEVRVVLDLERCGSDSCVPEEVEKGDAVEVGDSEAAD